MGPAKQWLRIVDVACFTVGEQNRRETSFASHSMWDLVVNLPSYDRAHGLRVLQAPFFPVPLAARVARIAVESIIHVCTSIMRN